jgi:hypothetical protein
VIAFSSFHRRQREDSIWADEYATPISAFGEGFRSQESEFLGAYVRVDCETGEVIPLNPEKSERVIQPPSDFGDSWSDVLEPSDNKKLTAYIQVKEKLADYFGFIGFRVGGEETLITLNRDIPDRGLVFEAPRNSLMCAVENRVFDDLLIGNFMKTTLIGCDSLYPHFTPYVAKYSDNGRADTKSDLRRYFWRYFIRAPLPMLSHLMEERSVNFLRNHLSDSRLVFKAAKSIYRMVKPAA